MNNWRVPVPGQKTALVWFSAKVVGVMALLLGLPLLSTRQFYSEHLAHQAGQFATSGKSSRVQETAAAALAMNQLNGYARYHEATAHFVRTDYPTALAKYNWAEPVMPHLPQLLRLRGQANYQLGKYQEAGRDMDNYFRMVPEPKSAGGYLWRINGMSHMQAGHFGAAITALLRSSQVPDQKAASLRFRANLAVAGDQPEMATQALLALVHGPNNGDAPSADLLRNATNAGRVTTLARALEIFSTMGGSFPGFEKTLAVAYTQTSRADEAIQMLQKLAQANKGDADLHLMLGDLLFKSGRQSEALLSYEEHLRLAPDSPFREEIGRRRALTPP